MQRPESGNVPRNWKQGGYLERMPKDPWGNDYQYLYPGVHGEVDIFSFGSDGQAGGEGYAADVGTWNLGVKHDRTIYLPPHPKLRTRFHLPSGEGG